MGLLAHELNSNIAGIALESSIQALDEIFFLGGLGNVRGLFFHRRPDTARQRMERKKVCPPPLSERRTLLTSQLALLASEFSNTKCPLEETFMPRIWFAVRAALTITGLAYALCTVIDWARIGTEGAIILIILFGNEVNRIVAELQSRK